MARKTRGQLKREGHKLAPLKPQAIRLSPETWEKLDWLAAEKGLQRSDLIRLILSDATRHVKPPKSHEPRTVAVTKEEWETLERVATVSGAESASSFLAKIVRRLIDRSAQQSEPTPPDNSPS